MYTTATKTKISVDKMISSNRIERLTQIILKVISRRAKQIVEAVQHPVGSLDPVPRHYIFPVVIQSPPCSTLSDRPESPC